MAERKSVAEVIAQCKAELEKRDAGKAPQGIEAAHRSEGIRGTICPVNSPLSARRWPGNTTCPKETAKANSMGVKGFKAHKTAGRQGLCQAWRHAARRLGRGSTCIFHIGAARDIVTLGVWLLKDAPIESHEFHVSAPPEMIEGGKTFSEVRPGISEKDLQETRHIRAFKDLPSAAAAFDAALRRSRPDIRSQNLRSSLRAERSNP